jgi:hypothetical protein
MNAMELDQKMYPAPLLLLYPSYGPSIADLFVGRVKRSVPAGADRARDFGAHPDGYAALYPSCHTQHTSIS